jgi:hypothetical protein
MNEGGRMFAPTVSDAAAGILISIYSSGVDGEFSNLVRAARST